MVGIAEFYLYMGFGADLLKKSGHQSLKTGQIRIRTPLKLANYFQFVSQTIGDEATTFLNGVQNFVKLVKNCGRNRLRTDLFTNTETDRQTEKN